MKKMIALILVCACLTGCTSTDINVNQAANDAYDWADEVIGGNRVGHINDDWYNLAKQCVRQEYAVQMTFPTSSDATVNVISDSECICEFYVDMNTTMGGMMRKYLSVYMQKNSDGTVSYSVSEQ